MKFSVVANITATNVKQKSKIIRRNPLLVKASLFAERVLAFILRQAFVFQCVRFKANLTGNYFIDSSSTVKVFHAINRLAIMSMAIHHVLVVFQLLLHREPIEIVTVLFALYYLAAAGGQVVVTKEIVELLNASSSFMSYLSVTKGIRVSPYNRVSLTLKILIPFFLFFVMAMTLTSLSFFSSSPVFVISMVESMGIVPRFHGCWKLVGTMAVLPLEVLHCVLPLYVCLTPIFITMYTAATGAEVAENIRTVFIFNAKKRAELQQTYALLTLHTALFSRGTKWSLPWLFCICGSGFSVCLYALATSPTLAAHSFIFIVFFVFLLASLVYVVITDAARLRSTAEEGRINIKTFDDHQHMRSDKSKLNNFHRLLNAVSYCKLLQRQEYLIKPIIVSNNICGRVTMNLGLRITQLVLYITVLFVAL